MPVNGEATLLEQVRNVVTTYKGTVGDGMSLADITKIARVEPITLISSSLVGTKELYNILHGVLNIYTGYYLQAVSILGTQIYDSRVLKILDKTNPDRDLKTFLTSGQLVYESYKEQSYVSPKALSTLTLENAKYTLPMLKSDAKASLESMKLNDYGYDEDDSIGGTNSRNKNLGTAVMQIDSFDKLGMTVGKVVSVSFGTGPSGGGKGKNANTGNTGDNTEDNAMVTVPVIIKLDTMITQSEVITSIATANADEITFGSRFRDALGGRINFIKDFIMCSDLITAQKRTMIKDVDGFYAQQLKRINNSKMYSVLSGNVSLAGISAIYVMSEEEEAAVQRKIGGKISNKTTRGIVFDNTAAMMLVVIDREWERVSIYVRDIDGFSQNSFDSFKSSTDKQNSQIMDMMKAFTMNNPASF